MPSSLGTRLSFSRATLVLGQNIKTCLVVLGIRWHAHKGSGANVKLWSSEVPVAG